MKLTLLFLVCFLASCSLVGKVENLVSEAKEAVVQVKATLAEAKTQINDAKTAADANADGKTTSSEWATWLAGGGLTVLLGGLLKLFSLQKQTDQLYDATHAPITPGPVAAK